MDNTIEIEIIKINKMIEKLIRKKLRKKRLTAKETIAQRPEYAHYTEKDFAPEGYEPAPEPYNIY